MKENEFDFDLESILSEFQHYDPKADRTPERRPAARTDGPRHAAAEPEELLPAEMPAAAEDSPAAAPIPAPAPEVPVSPAPEPETAPVPDPEEAEDTDPLVLPDPEEDGEEDLLFPEEGPYDDADEDEEPRAKTPLGRRFLLGGLSLILAAVALLCLAWSLRNIHPSSGAASAARRDSSLNEAGALDMSYGGVAPAPVKTPAPTEQTGQENETASQVPATPAPTPKPVYTIPRDALTAPAPNPACYGTVSINEADKILDVIAQARASGLLGEDETVTFDPGVNFFWDSNIQYYLDDTIMTICWKEVIDGTTCSFVETKIADGSQFRRKLAGDAFGSQNQYFATELSRSVNAVVAMNADYYLFRDFGIVVYDGELYRFNTGTYTGMYKKYNCVETCFVTGEGDFLFNHLGEETNPDALKQFIQDNDIRFSISFGPVLVENREVKKIDWYPVGEIDKGYSRAGIGQVAKYHYLYMSVNHSQDREARWSVNTFAQHFGEKNVINAYCLDGGQTGEIVFQGQPYNYIDFGKERQVSDIIYFATALPASEVSQ